MIPHQDSLQSDRSRTLDVLRKAVRVLILRLHTHLSNRWAQTTTRHHQKKKINASPLSTKAQCRTSDIPKSLEHPIRSCLALPQVNGVEVVMSLRCEAPPMLAALQSWNKALVISFGRQRLVRKEQDRSMRLGGQKVRHRWVVHLVQGLDRCRNWRRQGGVGICIWISVVEFVFFLSFFFKNTQLTFCRSCGIFGIGIAWSWWLARLHFIIVFLLVNRFSAVFFMEYMYWEYLLSYSSFIIYMRVRCNKACSRLGRGSS